MSDMNLVISAVNLYQDQYNQVDKLWNYFSVVTLAVVGFVIGSERATKSLKESLAIVSAYLVFCYGNYAALMHGQRLLDQLADYACLKAMEEGIDLSALVAIPPHEVSRFYMAVVIAVSLGVVAITYLRIRPVKGTKKKGDDLPDESP